MNEIHGLGKPHIFGAKAHATIFSFGETIETTNNGQQHFSACKKMVWYEIKLIVIQIFLYYY